MALEKGGKELEDTIQTEEILLLKNENQTQTP